MTIEEISMTILGSLTIGALALYLWWLAFGEDRSWRSRTIRLSMADGQYHACIADSREHFARGRTPSEAIGSLVINHGRTGLKVALDTNDLQPVQRTHP